ncbi:MAG: hypothetical protein HWN66_16645 [Candidatus Helarchaeota archaeon]|nr:hypothetical protein [Candidatus Helarchaeota archaeon]
MSIIRVVKNKYNPYLIMNKTGLNDKRLSLKAKGLLCYLLSKPDNWYVNINEIVSNSNNGIKSIHSAINELIKFGYIFKHQFRNNDGKFYNYNYLIYEKPEKLKPIKTTTQPKRPFRQTDKRIPDNSTLLINNNNKVIKDSLTTIIRRQNNFCDVHEDLNLQKLKKETILLLHELHIKNFKKLFDSYSVYDIFDYADWMLSFKSRIKNPTGFLISALKENWLDLNELHKSQLSRNT